MDWLLGFVHINSDCITHINFTANSMLTQFLRVDLLDDRFKISKVNIFKEVEEFGINWNTKEVNSYFIINGVC